MHSCQQRHWLNSILLLVVFCYACSIFSNFFFKMFARCFLSLGSNTSACFFWLLFRKRIERARTASDGGIRRRHTDVFKRILLRVAAESQRNRSGIAPKMRVRLMNRKCGLLPSLVANTDSGKQRAISEDDTKIGTTAQRFFTN